MCGRVCGGWVCGGQVCSCMCLQVGILGWPPWVFAAPSPSDPPLHSLGHANAAPAACSASVPSPASGQTHASDASELPVSCHIPPTFPPPPPGAPSGSVAFPLPPPPPAAGPGSGDASQLALALSPAPVLLTLAQLDAMPLQPGIGGKAACQEENELRQVCLQPGTRHLDLSGDPWPWTQILRGLNPTTTRELVGPGVTGVVCNIPV